MITITEHSQLLERTLSITYPLILIFGVYMVLNGHITPGGGFQGGAVLASVFIARYLTTPIENLDLNTIQAIEKVALLLIILFASAYLTLNLYAVFSHAVPSFIILSNGLIGLKVACGFTIIFYRFVYYESR